MPTLEEFTALQKALAEAAQRNQSLAGELRVVRTERDLLKEQLNQFKRQLFAAKSEAGATPEGSKFFERVDSGLPLVSVPGARGFYMVALGGTVVPNNRLPGLPDSELSAVEFDEAVETWLKD